MARSLETCAPAKVNLTLRVHGRRPDGYHLIESLVVFSGAADRIELEPDAPAGVEVTGGLFAAELSGENLLARALAMLETHHPELRLGRVRLCKNLPIAAGIGGGSADAGALLRLVRAINPEFAGAVDWAGLALSLGADVPVAMLARPALMWGIGEQLHPFDDLPPLALVLVNPRVPVPATKTRDVFRSLGAGLIASAPTPAMPPSDPDALHAYLAAQGNDLTPAATAVVPQIAEVLAEIGASAGCRLSRLSGAGPTCFGLYDDADAAVRAAAAIAARRPGWWISAAPAHKLAT